MVMFHVLVRSHGNAELVETITREPVNERTAEKIERGVNIKLNHDDYYTEIVEEK